MTPAELKTARKTLGLSANKFARVVGLTSGNAGRTVRRWEDGTQDVPGPVVVLTGLLLQFPVVRKALGI